jgi:cytochrome c553
MIASAFAASPTSVHLSMRLTIIPGSRHLAGFALFLGLCASTGQASEPASRRVPDTIAQRAEACTVCHGKEGVSTNTGYFPRIAGKPAGYLFQSIGQFSRRSPQLPGYDPFGGSPVGCLPARNRRLLCPTASSLSAAANPISPRHRFLNRASYWFSMAMGKGKFRRAQSVMERQ